jgi:hypothetical protein
VEMHDAKIQGICIEQWSIQERCMASSAQSTIWELTEPDQERMCVASTSVSRPSSSTLIGGREVGSRNNEINFNVL